MDIYIFFQTNNKELLELSIVCISYMARENVNKMNH